MSARPPDPTPAGRRTLAAGELHYKERFGPETVCRGAVLLECEWDGGVVEDGVLLGGLFRSGTFHGGTFWGGIYLSGRWLGGRWECGFDGDGRYRPRTDHPPAEHFPDPRAERGDRGWPEQPATPSVRTPSAATPSAAPPDLAPPADGGG